MSLPENMNAELAIAEDRQVGGKRTIVVQLRTDEALKDADRIDTIIDAVFDELDRAVIELRIGERYTET